MNKTRIARFFIILLIASFSGLYLSCKSEEEKKPEKKEEKAVITGEIQDYDQDQFEFTYDTYSPLEDTRKELINIDSAGKFRIEINTERPVKGVLYFGRYMAEGRGIGKNIDIYIEPGDSLHVQANVDLKSDLEMIDKTLKYTGTGVANNYFLYNQSHEFDRYEQRVQNNHKFIAYKQANDYKRTVDSIRDLKLRYLQSYADTSNLSPALQKIFEDEYINLAMVRKFNYPSSNMRFNDGVAPELPSDYYDFAENMEIDSVLDQKGVPYLRSTHFFLTNKYELAKRNGYNEDFITFIDSELKGRAKYIYMAYSLGRDFDPEIYGRFGEDSPYTDIAEAVKEKYKHLESMLPGEPAPPVEFLTMNNDTISSGKLFKDKFVYIDFWATWCKPCIREIPDLVKLEEEYHDENILFVSVSFDEEKEKWEHYVKKEGLTGVQLWVNPENKNIYDTTFNIKMIPRFVLIDNKGNIVDSQAPFPSSGAEIRNLLNLTLKGEEGISLSY